jgi:hypothetical protein
MLLRVRNEGAQMGRNPAELRVQENKKILKLVDASQPDGDQPGGIDWQASALRNDRCVIFRAANHAFDRFATEEKNLEAELAYFRLDQP